MADRMRLNPNEDGNVSFGAQGDAPMADAPLRETQEPGPLNAIPSAPASDEANPAAKAKKRRIMLTALLVVGGFVAWKTFDYVTYGRFIVSTEDAYVKADMSVLAAKVSGYVAEVTVTDNALVKKGDLLATIDSGDYKLAVEAAQMKIATQTASIERIGAQVLAQNAVIDQASAQLVAAKADSTRALAEFARASQLVESRVGTQQRLDLARADRDKTNAVIEQAKASIATAQANRDVLGAQKLEAERVRSELGNALARATRDLSFTEIRAPFDGVVGNKAAQPGQFVQPGTRLLALVPLESAFVEANFKETQLGRLRPGQTVEVTVDAYKGRTFEGVVESVSPASGAQFSLLPPENATGNFTKIVQRVPVRIRLPAEFAREGLFRPGLSVVVEVNTREEPKKTPQAPVR